MHREGPSPIITWCLSTLCQNEVENDFERERELRRQECFLRQEVSVNEKSILRMQRIETIHRFDNEICPLRDPELFARFRRSRIVLLGNTLFLRSGGAGGFGHRTEYRPLSQHRGEWNYQRACKTL